MEKCENLSTYCVMNIINLLVKVNFWLEYACKPDEPYKTFLWFLLNCVCMYFELNWVWDIFSKRKQYMLHAFWRETFMTSAALNLNKKRQLTKMMQKIRLWGLWCTAGNLLRRCKRCKKVHISSDLLRSFKMRIQEMKRNVIGKIVEPNYFNSNE